MTKGAVRVVERQAVVDAAIADLRAVIDRTLAGAGVLRGPRAKLSSAIENALKENLVVVQKFHQALSIDDRAAEMLDLYVNGRTLDEIGVEFDITRERVRQILTQTYGNYRALRPEEVNRERSLRRIAERNSEWDEANGAQVEELVAERVSDDEIASRLGVSISSVVDYRSRHGIRRTRGLDWTDEDIFRSMRTAYKSIGEPLTIKNYKEWRDLLPDQKAAPSYLTLMLRFSTFDAACLAAEVPFGGRTNLERRSDYIPEEEVWEHARQFVKWCSDKGVIPTSGTFGDYRLQVNGVPSLAIMCRRSGGFRKMIDKINAES